MMIEIMKQQWSQMRQHTNAMEVIALVCGLEASERSKQKEYVLACVYGGTALVVGRLAKVIKNNES